MIPISSTAPRPAAPPDVQAAERPARPASPSVSKEPLKPVRDEYVPEEKKESYGRYWLGRDRDGSPKIYFDSPEAAGEEPAVPGRAAPAGGDRGEERCTGNTDKVDREIRQLKEKREKLEEQLSSETDERKLKELERELSQVESELRRKDNDAYRRRHTVFTES